VGRRRLEGGGRAGGEEGEVELELTFLGRVCLAFDLQSGHDTTYRFEKRCANLATIDLNSLLYK